MPSIRYPSQFRSLRALKAHGFTMIELMIVLVIVGALVATFVFNSGGSGPRGKAIANRSQLQQLQANADRFLAEYGTFPAAWGVKDKMQTAAERAAMIQSIAGIYTGSDTALAAHSAAFPTYKLAGTATEAAARYTAFITTVGTGTPSTPRVIITQFRKETSGVIVNGDGTISASMLPDTAVLTGDFFNTTTNTAWGTAGWAAWPYGS